jgi:conjugal transfer pilus assembly protein TraW
MRCFSAGAALILALIHPVQAAPNADPMGLRAIRDQAQALDATARTTPPPTWLGLTPATAGAAAGNDLGRQALSRMQEAPSAVSACTDLGQLCGTGQDATDPVARPAEPPSVTYTVLVSRSLGTEALRAIFRAASGRDVRFLFRGVAPGERLMDMIKAIHALLDGIDPVPAVAIDPTVFREAGATVVPLLIARGPNGELARVTGLTAPAWLREQLQAGARGDLGVRGPAIAISEADLIEELQRRVAALDMDALREGAIKRFWQRATFDTLPVVTEPRERTIDPTITASADVLLPDGTKVIQAGASVNPLDHVPFTHRLIVFDASDPRQVETARRLGETDRPQRPLYLATTFDRAQGWDGLRTVEDRLDEPVYLLTPDVRTRFALERVPALVEARGRVFVVHEVRPDQLPMGSSSPRVEVPLPVESKQ